MASGEQVRREFILTAMCQNEVLPALMVNNMSITVKSHLISRKIESLNLASLNVAPYILARKNCIKHCSWYTL